MSKKFLAFVLAATMVIGSTVTAFASDSTTYGPGTALVPADTSGVDGTGVAEGLVNTKVYRVTLPVIPATSLNYTIDPQGLIAATSGARYGVEATGTGLYFVNHETLDATTEGTKTGLSQTSDEFQVVNKSTFPITVTIKSTATVGTAATNTLVPTLATAASELTAGATKVLLTYVDNGKTPTATALSATSLDSATVLGDAKAAYSFKYTEGSNGAAGSYSYDYDADGSYEFATLKFSYTGAVNVENITPWTVETAATATANEVRYTAIAAPTINVKYQLDEYTTDPAATGYKIDIAGPTAGESGSGSGSGSGTTTTEYQLVLNSGNGNLTYTFESNAPTGTLTAMKLNGTSKGGGQISQGNITYSGGKVVIKAAAVTALGIKTGDKIVFTIGDADYNFKY